jgi:DNA invertase Pin-like site-specific DNA recombinase
MFQMLGVFAEFERSMIQDRVRCGLARARANGKQLGRPSISDEKKALILELKAKGMGIRKIATQLQTGVGTVIKILKAVS